VNFSVLFFFSFLSSFRFFCPESNLPHSVFTSGFFERKFKKDPLYLIVECVNQKAAQARRSLGTATKKVRRFRPAAEATTAVAATAAASATGEFSAAPLVAAPAAAADE